MEIIKLIVCSFCRIDSRKTEFIVTGNDAAICDKCVELSMEIIKEKRLAKVGLEGT